jgi:CheY-like chemotaxis protein
LRCLRGRVLARSRRWFERRVAEKLSAGFEGCAGRDDLVDAIEDRVVGGLVRHRSLFGERPSGDDSDMPGNGRDSDEGLECNPVPVLVVDDQASFRTALRELIAATGGFVLVGESASSEAALDAVDELLPRLVIIDKRMPGIGGIEATKAIKRRHPEVVVLLISVEEAPDPQVLRSCQAAAFARKQELSPAFLRELWRKHGS